VLLDAPRRQRTHDEAAAKHVVRRLRQAQPVSSNSLPSPRKCARHRRSDRLPGIRLRRTCASIVLSGSQLRAALTARAFLSRGSSVVSMPASIRMSGRGVRYSDQRLGIRRPRAGKVPDEARTDQALESRHRRRQRRSIAYRISLRFGRLAAAGLQLFQGARRTRSAVLGRSQSNKNLEGNRTVRAYINKASAFCLVEDCEYEIHRVHVLKASGITDGARQARRFLLKRNVLR